MDFKVEITCFRCHCSFELRPSDKMALSDTIYCQNCGQEIPEDIATHLKVGLSELGLIPYITDDSEDLLMKFKGFRFLAKEVDPFD